MKTLTLAMLLALFVSLGAGCAESAASSQTIEPIPTPSATCGDSLCM